jgi:putative ATP-binding cassette transporter
MKLFAFLFSISRGKVAVIAITGLIAGVCNTGLLALINSMLSNRPSSTFGYVATFIALCAVMLLSRMISQTLLIRLSLGAIFDLRMNLSRRILATPLRHLEELGSHRLLAALTEDVPVIGNALMTIPLLCMHVAIIVACLVYLAYLSWAIFIGIVGFMIVGVGTYQLLMRQAFHYLKLAREKWDSLLSHFQALTRGTKELKLHRQRREAFISDLLEPSAASLKRHSTKGNTIYMLASSWGQLLAFSLIALLLFVVPLYGDTARIQNSYILVIIYMLTPLEVLLNNVPLLGRASVSLQKVKELGLLLEAQPGESDSRLEPRVSPEWTSLELKGVTHTYFCEEQQDSFSLGPVDLTFRPGELVLLVGGNGSGKTTLAKLITGLYTPEAGQVLLNDLAITDEVREYYRQHFSVVFSDFYLFENLLGLSARGEDMRASEYLAQLRLSHKVRINDGTFSSTDLSQGERKRLALLTAYLEDRPIYLFDEWAADQDPIFKRTFYLHLLPELKSRGKLILVISHDDQYYHIADRIIKLDYGKIIFDKPVEDAVRSLAYDFG